MSNQASKCDFLVFFQSLEDPRVSRAQLYPADEILLLAISAIMCGCETWEDIERFGKAKKEYLSSILPFSNGIPSDDTLRRFFAAINHKEFQECFIAWAKTIDVDITQGVVAIDGKKLRGSRHGSGLATYIVSAFCSEAKMVIGQEKVTDKSNEITAIPELLNSLEIKGATVTIDAMGCQTKIAEKIRSKEADYLLCVKKNQENLYNRIEHFFASGLAKQASNLDYNETSEVNRGRKETRKCHASSSPILRNVFNKWKDLTSVIKIDRERIVNGKTQSETAYYISSKPYNALDAIHDSRAHWSVENSLHWVLDVSFNEDASKISEAHAAANMAIMKHIALNSMRVFKPKRRSIKGFKKDLGWDNNLLTEVLTYICGNIGDLCSIK